VYAEPGATAVDSNPVDPTEADSPRVDPPGEDVARSDPVGVEPKPLDASEVDSPRVEPVEVDAVRSGVDPKPLAASEVDSPRVEPLEVDAARSDPAGLEPKPVDASEVDSSRVDPSCEELMGVDAGRPDVGAGWVGVVAGRLESAGLAGLGGRQPTVDAGSGVGRSGGVVAQAPRPARSSAGVVEAAGVGDCDWVTQPRELPSVDVVRRGSVAGRAAYWGVLSAAGRGAYCGVESARRASSRAWVSAQAWLSVRGWALAQNGDSPPRGA